MIVYIVKKIFWIHTTWVICLTKYRSLHVSYPHDVRTLTATWWHTWHSHHADHPWKYRYPTGLWHFQAQHKHLIKKSIVKRRLGRKNKFTCPTHVMSETLTFSEADHPPLVQTRWKAYQERSHPQIGYDTFKHNLFLVGLGRSKKMIVKRRLGRKNK